MFLKFCACSFEKKYLQIDEDDFKEEQNSVARLIQMLYNDDPEEMFKVFYLSKEEMFKIFYLVEYFPA